MPPKENTQTFPFIHFGFRLWRLREARGIRTNQIAEYLGISLPQYRKIETGESLPDRQMLVELARVLNVGLAKLKDWELGARRKVLEDIPLDGAMAYSKELEKVIERIKESYKDQAGSPLSEQRLKVFGYLKKDLYHFFLPPALPTNLFLVLDALRTNPEAKYPHEIRDFVLKGEALDGFLARDLVWGPFIFSAANLLYFQENPAKDIPDALKRITTGQLEELIFIGVAKNGICDVEEEISILEQKKEFGSLGAIMALELAPHLPKNVSPHYLYAAVLLQGLGTCALYTILHPSLARPAEAAMDEKSQTYACIDGELFNLIDYELHPVTSAMIAANWRFSDEVIDTVLLHHHHPVKEVTPLNAALKIVNFFVDCDFPDMSREDLQDLLKAYPQVDIPLDTLFKVAVKLKNMKEDLIERTSSMLEEKSRVIADYVAEKRKKMVQKTPAGTIIRELPKSALFRFEPEYLKTVVSQCRELVDILKNKILFPREGESMANYVERITALQLRLAYAVRQDLQVISERFKMSVEEIRRILKIK
ncbi:MAG: helix-turn-helix domain-containing protein [Deltaproteobacteria bacterium]|nr:helix-turn-helix domain-containing protein [Deltaproteobacteria bacterium]